VHFSTPLCEPGSRGGVIAISPARDNWSAEELIADHEGIATVNASCAPHSGRVATLSAHAVPAG